MDKSAFSRLKFGFFTDTNEMYFTIDGEMLTEWEEEKALDYIFEDINEKLFEERFYKEKTKNEYKLRRDILFESLLKSGFEAIFPKAGHFIMARNGNSNKLNTFDQCMRLTKLAGVTPLPLDCFFHDDNPEKWIRFSFSVPTTQLEEAAKRLVKNKFLNN